MRSREADFNNIAGFWAGAFMAVEGTVDSFGMRPKQVGGGSRVTLLLKNVKILNQTYDHMWIDYTNALAKPNLEIGCVISFVGKGKKYTKTNGTPSLSIKGIKNVVVKEQALANSHSGLSQAQ